MEADLPPVLQREHAPAAWDDIDDELGMAPDGELGPADIEGRAGDLAQQDILVADQKISLGEAHGGGAVAAAAGLVEEQRAVLGLEFRDQAGGRLGGDDSGDWGGIAHGLDLGMERSAIQVPAATHGFFVYPRGRPRIPLRSIRATGTALAMALVRAADPTGARLV